MVVGQFVDAVNKDERLLALGVGLEDKTSAKFILSATSYGTVAFEATGGRIYATTFPTNNGGARATPVTSASIGFLMFLEHLSDKHGVHGEATIRT